VGRKSKHHNMSSRSSQAIIICIVFIGSLKAGFVTERSELGSCRAFGFQYSILKEGEKYMYIVCWR